ncbi:MAG: hypothetical protein NC302_13515 [Bacteroidales bacterium]|nr:hypothetical protein [Bacteroidales bacterium]
MDKEMMGVTNEEMFLIILDRLDRLDKHMEGLGAQMNRLEERMDRVEERLDRVEERLDRVEERLDRVEERLDRVEERLDNMEARIDSLELDINMEFQAVRTEMGVVYKFSKEDAVRLEDKIDRISYTKDVEGYDKVNVRLEVLEEGYRELKEKVC